MAKGFIIPHEARGHFYSELKKHIDNLEVDAFGEVGPDGAKQIRVVFGKLPDLIVKLSVDRTEWVVDDDR